MKNTLKGNDKGAALVAVIMTMLVLSILSVALLSATTSNLKNGLDEREYQSSYYIAEGGVTYHAQEVKSKILDIYNDSDIDTANDFFNAIDTNLTDPSMSKTLNVSSGHFDEQYGGAPDAEVRVIKDTGPSADPNMRTYIIESTGTVDGITRKVYKPITFKWVNKNNTKLHTEYAIYTEGNMDNVQGTIKGPIFSKANIKLGNVVTVQGSVYSVGNITVAGGKVEEFTYSSGDTSVTGGNVMGSVYSNKKFSISNGMVEGSVYAKGEVNKVGGDIKGDVFSEKDISDVGWGSIKGTKSANTTVTLPKFPEIPTEEDVFAITEDDFPTFPSISEHISSLNITAESADSDKTLNLTNSITYIKDIGVHADTKLKIKYSPDSILMVDNFNVSQGTVELDGTGLLNLYVKDNITITAGSKFNHINSSDDEELRNTAEKLMVYIGPSSGPSKKKFSLTGDTNFNGSIFAYDADLELGASGNVMGNIFTLGNKVDISGGSSSNSLVLYAPNAHVEVGGSGKFFGPIIANTFKISGGGSVIYDPDKQLPGSPLTPEEPLDNVDILIASETPITER